jgi:DNA-binding transcriptional LysR family regulator
LFAPELKSGAVVSVLEDWSLPSVDLWALFPAGRQASAKARAFTDFIERQLTGREALQGESWSALR